VFVLFGCTNTKDLRGGSMNIMQLRKKYIFCFHLPENTKYNILKKSMKCGYARMRQWNIYKWLEEFKRKWKPAQDQKIPGWFETEFIYHVEHCFLDNKINRFWV
jgi:hypothetical protein